MRGAGGGQFWAAPGEELQRNFFGTADTVAGQQHMPLLPDGPHASMAASHAMHHQQRQGQAPEALAVAVQAAQHEKGTPRKDGVTPKSVFGWQPQSGTASPSTPYMQHAQQQLGDTGMRTPSCSSSQW